MKKTNQNQQMIGLVLFCATSLISLFVNIYFTEECDDILSEINPIFDFSIREDKSIRKINLAPPVYEGYNNVRKEFSLTIKDKKNILSDADKYRKLAPNEKSYIADHTYLLFKNPIKIHVLDSIFKTNLHENDIFNQSEIQYIVNKDTAYSTKNRSFYISFLPLEKIKTGLHDQITLQAFVKMPFYYRISNFTSIAVCLLFFISVGSLIRIYIRKKDEEELQIISETDSFILPPTSDLFKYAKQITPTIFFNEKKEAIIRNGETIYLTASRLTVFTLMMGDDDYFVPTATIKAHLWPKNDDIKNVLNKMIERLRIDLRPIPELEVLYDRKRKGYYLKVVENAFVNPKHIHEVSIFENIYIQTKTIIAKFWNNNSKDEGVAC